LVSENSYKDWVTQSLGPSIKSGLEICILAAGLSTRLGQPKQLVPIRGVPLIRHIVLTALGVGVSVSVVVSPMVDLSETLADLEIKLITKQNPSLGLGSSIKLAASYAKAAHLRACLFLLGDQPFIGLDHLRRLVSLSEARPQSIIATAYPQGGPGVPALFPAIFFDDLLAIQDQCGAKGVIQSDKSHVAIPTDQESLFDLDTPEDLVLLAQRL
jgi:molybdenum cofactor cytidylyltransferase